MSPAGPRGRLIFSAAPAGCKSVCFYGLCGPLPRLDFDNHFHFNWYVERQLGHTDGRPSVFTDRLSEDLDHQVRTAIDDLGLIGEAWRRVDLALQPRGEWADQVAQDRWLAENRRGTQPAHGGGGMTDLQ